MSDVNVNSWVNFRRVPDQYIAPVHSVLKGQQPNLVAIVCSIDVNQASKESQKITLYS